MLKIKEMKKKKKEEKSQVLDHKDQDNLYLRNSLKKTLLLYIDSKKKNSKNAASTDPFE